MGKNYFCVAYGCNHHRAYGATCTFFIFPEDPEYFQRWVNACKREVVYESGKRTKWTPSEYQKLCSCHFENDRCPDPKSRKSGNKNKIPTIFSHKENQREDVQIGSHDKLQEPSPTASSFSESTASVDTVSETTNQHESLQESLRAPERNGHDYLQTPYDRTSFQNFEDLSLSDPDFTKFFNYVQKDSKIYQEMCSKNQIFKMEVIQQNKQLFNFYTGLDLDVFNSLFTYLQRKASSMQCFHGERTTYVQPFNLDGFGVKRKPCVTRQLNLQEEFFSVLYRLQTGHLLGKCSLRFGVSTSQFSRNFTTWINLLSIELELLCKNAEPDEDVGLAIGIHPSGAVTYISKAYPGKSSDKQITQESLDLIDSLIPGQKVMVDRGFTIEEDLPCGVK
uniref:THAP-type domain-containing protein n=1 Tax=Magallana gigas TaxID=29159 RepID=A0A8W8LDI8_MAGGI